MEKLLQEIKTQLEDFAKNAEAQVEKGNKAAGTRARKATLELTKLFKEFRKKSMEANACPRYGFYVFFNLQRAKKRPSRQLLQR